MTTDATLNDDAEAAAAVLTDAGFTEAYGAEGTGFRCRPQGEGWVHVVHLTEGREVRDARPGTAARHVYARTLGKAGWVVDPGGRGRVRAQRPARTG